MWRVALVLLVVVQVPNILIRPVRIVPPPLVAPPSVAWEQKTYTGDVPRWLGQRRLHYDPTSEQVLTHSAREGSGGIYSGDIHALNVSTLVGTLLPGGISAATTAPQLCANYPDSTPGGYSNGDTSSLAPNWPAHRHPDFANIIVNGKMYQWSGLACNNPDSGIGTWWRDFWRYNLNADPTDNTWTNLTSTMANVNTVYWNGTMWHDSTRDVLLVYGNGGGNARTWVYADTDTLTAGQIAAGCSSPRTWTLLHSGPSGAPPYVALSNVLYDSVTDRGWLFTWDKSGTTTSTLRIWEWHPTNHIWTNRTPGNSPDNDTANGHEWLVVRISIGTHAGKFIYHRTGHRNTSTSGSADYLFDPATYELTELETTGTGPHKLSLIEYVPTGTHGLILAHEWGSGMGTFWHGVIQ